MNTEYRYQSYLPNFRYKNGKIIFKLQNPIKMDILDKTVWVNDIEIPNMKYYDRINYYHGSVSYQIVNLETDKGLKINICSNKKLNIDCIVDIIKTIESNVLDIYYSCDDYEYVDDSHKNKYNLYKIDSKTDDDW